MSNKVESHANMFGRFRKENLMSSVCASPMWIWSAKVSRRTDHDEVLGRREFDW
jgi:hypothetical protein